MGIAAVDALLASPSVQVLHPGDRYWPLLQDTITQSRATGNLIMDAAIVAVCREHGVRTIVSDDRDFRRFPRMRLRTVD